MQKLRGFTLIEVLIVVGIVAILASIAFPAYTKYITRSKIAEAAAQLSDMRVKLEQHYQDNRTYATACLANTVAPIPAPPAVKYFSYTCPTKDATSFVVQVDGLAAQNMAGFSYSIDQSGNRRTITTGWGTCANTACWVTRQDCSC